MELLGMENSNCKVSVFEFIIKFGFVGEMVNIMDWFSMLILEIIFLFVFGIKVEV